MTNRRSLNAKKYAGQDYSFRRKNNPVKKKKKHTDPKDKKFELLWKNYFKENYIDHWYDADFRDALAFYKRFNSKKQKKIASGVINFGKETSDEQKDKISFISVLQKTATFLKFEIAKDLSKKSKNEKPKTPNISSTQKILIGIVGGPKKEINIPEVKNLIEGTQKQITLTKYERNPIARQRCIDYYGPSCVVCNFNFENTYGSIGKDFIHVHHLVKVSSQQKEYEIDPIKDLRPVCANCHAIIHRKKKTFDIDEIREFIKLKP